MMKCILKDDKKTLETVIGHEPILYSDYAAECEPYRGLTLAGSCLKMKLSSEELLAERERMLLSPKVSSFKGGQNENEI